MAATFQNGRHENIKQCIHLKFWRISMCNTCINRFSRSKNLLLTFKLKMMFIFKMTEIYIYIQINTDRGCYLYDDFQDSL